MTATKLGYQLLGNPPDAYKSKAGGGKIMKIVGDEADLQRLNDWVGKVEILQGRLITIEPRIEAARDRNNLADIPQLARVIADIYAAVDARIGAPGVWWEIGPIMPAVVPLRRPDGVLSSWIGEWNAACAEEFAARGLRSVCFGFATGTPQVKPFANTGGHGPDEWPLLYPALARLNKLGRKRTRIGVEEYIVAGRFVPGDLSNTGRVKHVYDNHLKPNGWLDLLFRVIESSFDLPGMHDVSWMTVDFCWGELAKLDLLYATMPYVDAVALYAVCDPLTNQNESRFAFTPGDRHQPRGYLEGGQTYFTDNPPVGGPIEIPVPPDPTPEPPPAPPTTRTLFDMRLRYDPPADQRHYQPGDTFGDRWVPLDDNGQPMFFYGWNESDAKISHVEPYPPMGTSFPAPVALRIQNQAPSINFWFGVILDTVPGDVLTVTLGSDAEIIDLAGDVKRRVAVDTNGGVNKTVFSEVSGQGYALATATITATGPRTTVMAHTRCSVPARVNVDYDIFRVVATTPPVNPPPPDPTPTGDFPAWYIVATGDTARLRKRLAPVNGDIVELQVNGSEVLIESITDGWAKLRGANLYMSAQYLRRK